VVLGRRGAVKTTTLRVIAGLTAQDEGSVLIDGEVMDGITPAERDVAFVFQQYSLYPTMTVFDNLAFPLRSPMRKTDEGEIQQIVGDVTEVLRINHLLDRKTAHLSGGEMQRVAIGRAIVRNPRVFLMDEPLSNLDAKLREALRVELQHLQKDQGITTVFVTHDQIEALTMADRIAVLNEGEIVQVGSPDDIYDQPASTYVAQMVGTPRINLFDATRDDGKAYIKDSDLHISLPEGLEVPENFLLGIRPEDILLDEAGGFKGTIELTEPLGVETILHIQSGSQTLQSTVPGMIRLNLHEEISFKIEQDRLHFFDLDGQRVG
jgi:multiple sugar transport system ATP-binding protein